MKKRFYLLAIIIIISSNLPPLFAQPAAPLPISPQIIIGKLSNGLTYYIRKNQEPKNRVELRLVVNVGSILENEQQRGLAHFAEHMAFNGTKRFKKQELVNFLEKSGVQFGADLNAYTSFDETVYELQLPTDSIEVFKKGFDILEDWAHNVSFEPAEIDKERGVVIEEWRLGQGADERLRKKYFPVILKGSKYAERLPIGTKQNLETFKHKTLIDFYKTWYRPNLQAVVVVGDVDVKEVEQLIKEQFATIPAGFNAVPRKKFGIPDHTETYTSIVTDKEQPYNVVQLLYMHPEIPAAKTVQQYRASIVRQLFNSMMSARFNEIGQQPDAPFLFAYAGYGNYIGNKDAYQMYAVAKDGKKINSSSEILLRENARVLKFGFTETELERSKTEMMASIENQYNERDKTKSADLVNELVNHFLKNEPIPGVEYEYQLYQKYLPVITVGEVNALIKQWVKPTNRVIIVTAPESEQKNLPTAAKVLAQISKPVTGLTAYIDKVTTGNLLAAEPTSGTITSERKIEALGVTELTLSNGIKVVLKPTDFKNNEIAFSAISAGGTSLYNNADYLSAATASNIVVDGGVGNYDQISLQKYLAGKNLFVSPSISTYAEGITGFTVPKDLETALQLVYGYMTEPRKDTSMFRVFTQQIEASLVNKNKDPNSVFSDTVAYAISNYHPRSRPLELNRLNEIEIDKAFTIYKERFASSGDFIFTFVGNFLIDTIKPLLAKYLGSLPQGNTNETWKDVGIRYPKGIVNKIVKKGQEKKSSVRMTFTGETAYSALAATQINQLCQALAIKLREVLREDQGGVYGVSVRGGLNREPINNYAITIAFGCAPENVANLSKLVLDGIAEMKANGAPAINVQKVIAEDTRSTEISVKENNYWLYNLQNKYYRNEDPTTIIDEQQMLKQLTVQQTKVLANLYFDNNNVATFVLMPE